jgi:CheY-like chemotaxis protein
MTAHAFAGEREKSLHYGMNEYIAKPIDERELFGLIGRFTGMEDHRPAAAGNGIPNEGPRRYPLIDLTYMQSISEGNREYEKIVTEEFIASIPQDIGSLESALLAGNQATIRQTAHSMRSDIAIMGLLEKLRPYLDALEYDPFEAEKFQQAISTAKTICGQALTEARHFYAGL